MRSHHLEYAGHNKRFRYFFGIVCCGLAALVFAGRAQSAKKGIAHERLSNARDDFPNSGFVEMVPPLRLPLRSWRHKTEVWFKVPEGARITTRASASGWSIVLPAGSEAARLEMVSSALNLPRERYRAADVRGTRFERQDEVFYLLRPTEPGEGAALSGWSFHRSSEREHARAMARLELMATGSAENRARELATLHRTGECAACHQHDREANQRPHQFGVANRGTDGSGCYQVQGVLASHAPLEQYFNVETNLDDPFISFDCGARDAIVDRSAGSVRCPDGSVPWGSIDIRRALQAGDSHAQAVCRSRQYLFDHLDLTGQHAFQESFEECGIRSVASAR